MRERREYYRVHSFGRVAFRALEPYEEDEARQRVRARHTPAALAPEALDGGLDAELRLQLELMQRIAFSLDRLDRHLQERLRGGVGEQEQTFPERPVPITLSGSGFAAPLSVDVTAGRCVEATLDLWEMGVPLIPCVARVLGPDPVREPKLTAMRFEEILPEDRERLIRLSIRCQSQALREDRKEENE